MNTDDENDNIDPFDEIRTSIEILASVVSNLESDFIALKEIIESLDMDSIEDQLYQLRSDVTNL